MTVFLPDKTHSIGLGFDASASPAPGQYGIPSGAPSPWLMVPLDDDAFFCLQDGAGLTLQGSEDSEALILMTEQGGSNARINSSEISPYAA
jgi:hypothetical protein